MSRLAERLAQLRVVPQAMLPSTLKHKILLPNVAEIRLEYSRNAKEFGPMFQFYRKYIADLRFNNPDLKIHRNASADGPLVGKLVLVGKKGGEGSEAVIECVKMKNAEELKDRIVQLNEELL